jgi:neuron navigator 2
MNRMKNEMLSLKLDNERLQQLIQQKGINPSALFGQHNNMLPADHRLSLGDPANFDLLLADSGSRGAQRITLSVRLSPTNGDGKFSELQLTEILIGIVSVSGSTTWDQLSETVRKSFTEYLIRLDPGTSLGLNGDSISSLHVGEVLFSSDSTTPELLPCGYLVGDNTNIAVSLKGAEEKSVDALAFETLIPKSIVQRYVSLLIEHRRIILCGPSGTGKTFLAHRLAEYLVLRGGDRLCPGSIATFSVDHKSGRELRQYLSSVADQCEQKSSELPCVIILDSLHHVASLSEVFNGFLSVHYQTSPYIIGTMNQTASTCSPTNLQLHHNFRWVLCANHMEPVQGFLARYLRRRLADAQVRDGGALAGTAEDDLGDVEKVVDWIPRVWQHLNKFLETHSSSDVTVGPRLFLSCPMDAGAVQVWFNDLWNYSIVPYLLEAIKEGVQTYGSRVPWEDPSDWVIKTYPWNDNQSDTSPDGSASSSSSSPLLRLRPEDVGYDSQAACVAAATSSQKSTPPASLPNDGDSSDPLMNMLMRLQEAAGYSASPASHNDATDE